MYKLLLTIFFLQNLKMKAIVFTIVILLNISIYSEASSVTQIQFGNPITINLGSSALSHPCLSKVSMGYLYLKRTASILKINVTTGVIQASFTESSGSSPQVNDFLINANGTKIYSCNNNDKLVRWNIALVEEQDQQSLDTPCQQIIHLQSVNRFILTHKQRQTLTYVNAGTLQQISVLNLDSQDYSHTLHISEARNSYISIRDDYSFKYGTFSYTSSAISLTSTGGSTMSSNIHFKNRVSAAQNISFDFFMVQNTLKQISFNGSFDFQTYDIFPNPGTIIQFKQLSKAAEQFAFISSADRNKIFFANSTGIIGQKNFSVSQDIEGFQICGNKLVIFLSSKIVLFEIECSNGLSYDPNTFSCVNNCPSGQFLSNQTCTNCHISCATCENNTGCLNCAIGLTPISTGILCQLANNNASVNQTVSNQTVSNQTISSGSIEQADLTGYSFDNITSQVVYIIMSFPKTLQIPIQSSILLAISDFWIYSYHNYTYGEKITEVFSLIQKIEQKKWSIVQYDQRLNIKIEPIEWGLSNYSSFANPKFLETESRNSTFIESLLQFFSNYIPIVIAAYLIYRYVFYKTFKYRVSRHFRKYSLNIFLIFTALEGNFQYICYCCFNQSQILFSFSFIDRLNALAWTIFFFFTTVFAFGSYYIAYWHYPKLSKLFIEQMYRFIPAFTAYTMISTAKNFVLGAIQSIAFNFYKTQIILLLAVHFFVIFNLLFVEVKYGIFKSSIVFNSLLLQTAIKIILQFLFLIQQGFQRNSSLFLLLEDSLIVLLYVWASIILFRIIFAFIPQNKPSKGDDEQIQNLKSYQQAENQNQQIIKIASSICQPRNTIKQDNETTHSLQKNNIITGIGSNMPIFFVQDMQEQCDLTVLKEKQKSMKENLMQSEYNPKQLCNQLNLHTNNRMPQIYKQRNKNDTNYKKKLNNQLDIIFLQSKQSDQIQVKQKKKSIH